MYICIDVQEARRRARTCRAGGVATQHVEREIFIYIHVYIVYIRIYTHTHTYMYIYLLMYKKLGAELAPAAPEEVRAIHRDADYG